MNKLLVILGLSLALISCQDIPPDMSRRVALLESQANTERAANNLRFTSLEVRMSVAENDIIALQALAAVVSDLSSKYDTLSTKYGELETADTTLTGELDSLSLVIGSLSAQLAAKITEADANALIATALSSYVTTSSLAAQLAAINTKTTSVYQCRNGSSVSKEKILKINSVFYAVMNHSNGQIALEPLTSGAGYVTTDSTFSCSFNGDGTNLEML